MGSRALILGTVCLALLALSLPAAAQDEEEAAAAAQEEAEAAAAEAGAGGIEVDYYTPEYYLDYPVYYDDAGQPIYYVGNVVYRVPASYGGYANLLRHYRMHRPNYVRWYRERGHRHHGFRRAVRVGGGYTPLYHDGSVVYYDDSGNPYYYHGAQMVYIPRTHPRHAHYRSYYVTHRPRYRAWYRTHGRSYRAAPAAGPYRVAPAARPYRAAPPAYGAPYARPVREAPSTPGYQGGAVDCRRNPGHPACRRQAHPGYGPPAHRGHGRGRHR